ncbi:LysR substrate-binding domain-containing protein [Komagataeibacter rhaeticus]|uniref:LysR family transcriptional regulator n=1 Tax=Komagataeibacter rhaeticus TaxID=215221 RepID=A0A858JMV3_9PROT|nr:LysR substrate-binding domain-containing protein [Komagataeibacter rhaeticus]KDU95195.1 LysR family transcriptional regulator [Komagataeibacter rhaeticus AF1]MBL7240682.1 LysR family transcriptional regulator [Komagataeibacter rhaeticus]QIP35067.1 LysR family transcriptional regulator [Komagataeibacter rhaeticus]QOC47620.1 LysR family transcriptional regulator [Komagataeibacter rhaeticus]WPP23031.1 LysR substrate-binding domain-containing protein [Komagataeibacter rhaeticus]
MDIRRLQAFVKIIDLGSISRAADLLNIAQPALSQQLATLESVFKQKLVIRSKSGVTPTTAGSELYRHAQTLTKQFDRAMVEISQGAGPLVGKVSVGLSPYSAGSTLSVELLRRVRARLPNITLHLTESFDDIYSELIMTGRLDMAVIHGAGPIKGVIFTPLMKEEFFLLAPHGLEFPQDDAGAVQLVDIKDIALLLPPKHNFVRKSVDMAFLRKQLEPHIVAEIEALSTLQGAIEEGIGSTILPWSVASRIMVPGRSRIYPLRNPVIQEDVSLCIPEIIPETEASVAVRELLIELARAMATSRNWPGTQATT